MLSQQLRQDTIIDKQPRAPVVELGPVLLRAAQQLCACGMLMCLQLPPTCALAPVRAPMSELLPTLGSPTRATSAIRRNCSSSITCVGSNSRHKPHQPPNYDPLLPSAAGMGVFVSFSHGQSGCSTLPDHRQPEPLHALRGGLHTTAQRSSAHRCNKCRAACSPLALAGRRCAACWQGGGGCWVPVRCPCPHALPAPPLAPAPLPPTPPAAQPGQTGWTTPGASTAQHTAQHRGIQLSNLLMLNIARGGGGWARELAEVDRNKPKGQVWLKFAVQRLTATAHPSAGY